MDTFKNNRTKDQFFNAQVVAEKLKEETRAIRRKAYFRRISKLDKFKSELILLHNQNLSLSELQRWLKSKKITCSKSTIQRYLKKWVG